VREVQRDDEERARRTTDRAVAGRMRRCQHEVIARREIQTPRRSAADGLSTLVIDERATNQSRPDAGCLRPETEVDVLEAEEVALVQQADALKHVARDQHQASAHGVDISVRHRGRSGGSGGAMPHPPGTEAVVDAVRAHEVG